MGVDDQEQSRKFITTEPLGKSGEAGEQLVWDAVQDAFATRKCIGYWRYPIFSKVGEVRKEPDILIADLELGLIVIEVKSVTIDQLMAITGHLWEFQNFYTAEGNPYEQAENQLFALLGYCEREPGLRKKVSGRVLVALPLITQEQWRQKGFHQLPSCPPILFQDHLQGAEIQSRGMVSPPRDREMGREEDATFISINPLLQLIEETTPVIKRGNLNQQQWQLLQAVIGGAPVFRQLSGTLPHRDQGGETPPLRSRADVLVQVRSGLSELDLQQEHIGKQIPPGPQRIRGIAGSGKTVLLCQKAAHMHLKHADWQIALVFFSRSLYYPIIEQVDKWIRRFSHGEVQYDPKNPQLRVLHAWGAKNQPGLYGTICHAAGVRRLTVFDTERKQPNEALAEVCTQLIQQVGIPQLFDAILIDEGQDLMVDDVLKYQDKQPFYWMAYQALRPPDSQHPEQRRLIWAYDEAQSLESLNVPTASELFGEELGQLVTGQYPGGIRKSEIMHRCYRTPAPILTAAHAMGMGLLRSAGMISGITRTEDWQALGYEVTGRFTPGQQITLKLSAENSPNQVPQLWEEPVLKFQAYRTRQEELTALAANIFHNLKHDGLKPSRNILVIILGAFYEAMKLETHVAEFLMEQGIDIFIPSATECNVLKPGKENRDPNKFWCEGGVTVSRVHRAKGNEADMVYVVGLDNVARDEGNVTLRNQLFVALTRARGWLQLSGIGNYGLYTEMWRVMQSGDTFTFTFKRPPKREFAITDIGELLKRYATGGRNFQGADLANAQLRGVNLSHANLVYAILRGADLSEAQLDGVKLIIADLSDAQLRGASLRKAKLMGANLQGADLQSADLTRADLSDADLTGANLESAELTGAILEGAQLREFPTSTETIAYRLY